jgi:hypothetical protein
VNGYANEMLEIVGFNGAPSVECGRALAVARRKSDGMYCVLGTAENNGAATWYDEEEAAAFAKARRWTRFCEPVPFPRSCAPGSDGDLAQPLMVIFAAYSLLDIAGRVNWPARFHGESLRWRHLQQYDESVQAACGPADSVEALLDEWATCLKNRYDAMYHDGRDQASLKRAADFMLCAARSRALRWEAYLRYAMAQDPDRVRQTFDAFARNEFPDVPWEAYLEEIKNLAGVLKSVPAPMSQPAAPVSPVPVRRKLERITQCQPIEVQLRPAA